MRMPEAFRARYCAFVTAESGYESASKELKPVLPRLSLTSKNRYLLVPGAEAPAFGVALVVSFSPVALIAPARFAEVLPAPSLVCASGALLAPDWLDTDASLEDVPLDASAAFPFFFAFGVALVVSFSPVALILPARFSEVLPAPSLVCASGALLAPDDDAEEDGVDELAPLDDWSDVLLPAADCPEADVPEEAPCFGVALVVSFSPVALILPARFSDVLPAPSFVCASAPAAQAAPVPNIIASVATPSIRFKVFDFDMWFSLSV
jgi:hypothetical protein